MQCVRFFSRQKTSTRHYCYADDRSLARSLEDLRTRWAHNGLRPRILTTAETYVGYAFPLPVQKKNVRSVN
jgi:hypothetical protein